MKELIKKIISNASGYGEAEAAITSSKSFGLDYENELLKASGKELSQSLTVRITQKDGGFGVCISSPEKWKLCIEEAAKIAKLSKPDKDYHSIPEYKKSAKVSMHTLKIKDEELVKFGSDMIDSASSYDKRIKIGGVVANCGISDYYFMNSNNIFNFERSGYLTGSISVKCGEINASESHVSNIKKFSGSDLGKKAAELCIKSLNPKKMETQKTNVVLNYWALSDLIEKCITSGLNGFEVQKKSSVYSDKKGQKVMDEKINIIDDGLMEDGLYTSSRDYEGIPRQKTTLVENGIIKDFMYDYYTAKKENRESTGNCPGISRRPSIYESNFMIKKGDMSFDEIIKETKKGLYVNELIGTHTVDSTSGNFSLQVNNSFAIKNGEIDYPVKETMISGNVFELMKQAKYIGNKYRQEDAVICPVICFENVQVIS